MRKEFTHLVFLLAILCIPMIVLAQDTIKSIDLDSISIKAKSIKFETITPDGDKLIDEQLSNLQTYNVGDAAKYLSGVMIRDYGGLGGAKIISVRGLSANHTVITYDGIPLFDNQSGQIDLSKYSSLGLHHLTISNAQLTDLLSSATSIASASSFNIETIKPNFTAKDYEGYFSNSFGSYGFFNQSSYFAKKLTQKDLLTFMFDVRSSQGNYPYILNYGAMQNFHTEKLYRDNNSLFSYNGQINYSHKFNLRNLLKIKLFYYYSDRELPSNVTLYYQNSNQELYNQNLFLQSSFISYMNENWTYKNNTKFDYSYTNYRDPDYFGYVNGLNDIYKQKYFYTNNALAFSPNKYLAFSFTNDLIYNSLNANTLQDNPERFSSLSAIMTEFSLSKLSLFINVLHSFYLNNYLDINKIYYRFSPFVNLKFSTDNYTLSIFYKDIFRVPTYNELYYRRVGNVELKPEKTKQFCIANTLYFQINNLQIVPEVAIYYSNVSDKIIAIARNLFLYSMLNYGKVNIYGMDAKLTMQYKLNEKLNTEIKANYSYQKAIDNEETSFTYKQDLPYMPRNLFSTSFAVNYKRLHFGYSCFFSDKRYSLQENIEANLMRAYNEQNMNISYKFSLQKHQIQDLILTFALRNIFNSQYEVIRSYPMIGRNYSIKVDIKF